MEQNNKLQELENKVKELQKICLQYSSCVYSFLGEFSEADILKLNTFERLAFKELKEKIDTHISSDNYKEYLKHRYIDKDLTNDMLFDFMMVEFDTKFNQTILDEDFDEDDTDTLIINEMLEEEQAEQLKFEYLRAQIIEEES